MEKQKLNAWKDNGEYWTRTTRLHRQGGGIVIESVKKNTNYVQEFISSKHAKTTTNQAI